MPNVVIIDVCFRSKHCPGAGVCDIDSQIGLTPGGIFRSQDHPLDQYCGLKMFVSVKIKHHAAYMISTYGVVDSFSERV